MTDVDPQSLIDQAREVCEGATPGPWNVIAVVDEDQIAVISVHPVDLTQCSSADENLLDAARDLLPALAGALEHALQYKAQLTLAFEQHRRTQRELAELKAKQVDLLADAYDKGRAFNEDVDDREEEHG